MREVNVYGNHKDHAELSTLTIAAVSCTFFFLSFHPLFAFICVFYTGEPAAQRVGSKNHFFIRGYL